MLYAIAVGPSISHADGPAKAPTCDSQRELCVTGAGKATFEADKSLTFEALAKEDKKYAKKALVNVRIDVLGGRASLFVDGRWMGLAGAELALRPGRHLVTLQDKSRVLARGILTIKDRSGPIDLELRHPESSTSGASALDDL